MTINGQIVHAQAATTKDDSSRGRSHGDRVIAAGVCLQGINDRPVPRTVQDDWDQHEPPPNTPAARQAAYERSQRTDDDWDDRGLGSEWRE